MKRKVYRDELWVKKYHEVNKTKDSKNKINNKRFNKNCNR
jgi:hypothetical protein